MEFQNDLQFALYFLFINGQSSNTIQKTYSNDCTAVSGLGILTQLGITIALTFPGRKLLYKLGGNGASSTSGGGRRGREEEEEGGFGAFTGRGDMNENEGVRRIGAMNRRKRMGKRKKA